MAADKPQTNADSQRVLAALMGLHRAYPLVRRMNDEACDDMRETYRAVLLCWIQTGAAPLTQNAIQGLDVLQHFKVSLAFNKIIATTDKWSQINFSGLMGRA